MNFFKDDPKTAYEAKVEAQRIAFAPVMFQACRILRDAGILELIQQSRAAGMTLNEVVAKINLPPYGIRVLLESGLGIGLFCLNDGRYTLTKLGYFMFRDTMTRVNMDVVHEVCYRGMFDLDKSIEQGKPIGLKTLGDWKTFYEGLSSLTPKTRDSWLAFDHYYSDAAFPAALKLVFADRPKRLLDVGGNTGKWAVQCAKFNPDVQITIADLPQQLDFARETVRKNNLDGRVDFFATNLLDESKPLPGGHDAIWMSQFLDCFSLHPAARGAGHERRQHVVYSGTVLGSPTQRNRRLLPATNFALFRLHRQWQQPDVSLIRFPALSGQKRPEGDWRP